MLEGAAGRVVVLWGWRRAALAVVAGAASALAMPPHDLFPVLFLTLPVLVWLIDGCLEAGPRARLRAVGAAAFAGWCFGFGYFLAGLHWVGAAFLVEADLFGWMMPFAVVALPAGLALFTAAGTALARAMWSPGPARVFAFAAALALSEFARAHLFTGFPWNLFGYALAATPATMQGVALVGVHGMTLLALLVFASPAALTGRGTRGARWSVPVMALAILAALAGHGALRLASAGAETAGETRVRIVQPAIDQRAKWRPENRGAIVAGYLELSDVAASAEVMGVRDVDVLIWPESALPLTFDWNPEVLSAIAALLPERTTLVTGMQRVAEDASAPVGWRSYNSVMVIDHTGTVRDVYDKVHLVPFGEFLPFQRMLEAIGLRQLTRLRGGFSRGDGERLMRAGAGPAFQPLICYEIIFPGAVLGGDDRPGFLLNVTNDAWFGDSAGPWQHLRQARLRAVEQGLPVLRAANTGISAVIDPYGRLRESLELGRRGVIDSAIPAPLPPTFYARFGGGPFGVLLALALVVAIWGCRR